MVLIYTPMQSTESATTNRRAIYGLAIIGFIALISVGIWLALYSARFVPGAVNRLGAAAVSLSQIFVPKDTPTLTVIPFAPDNTIPIIVSTSTAVLSTAKVAEVKPAPAKIVSEPRTYTENPMDSTTPVTLYGLPDLAIRIDSIGYLASSSLDSFVATSTVPARNRLIVKFTITNIGTNVASAWRVSASIPTQSQYIAYSALVQSLLPGATADGALGFDQATPGSNKMVSITANFDRAITESNYENNSASAQVTILGN